MEQRGYGLASHLDGVVIRSGRRVQALTDDGDIVTVTLAVVGGLRGSILG